MSRQAPGVRITRLVDEAARAGEPLELGQRLLQCTFEDNERQADRVVLLLDNGDQALFEREDVMAGTVLEVAWGYPGNMSVPRRVVIKKLKGFVQLTVEAHALSALMNQEVKTRNWVQHTRSEVVQKIAKAYGYTGRFVDIGTTTETLDVINQTAETDAQFLQRLATREGYIFYIDGRGFHFHLPDQDMSPTHIFTWYGGEGDLLDVHVTSDVARRAGKVTVRGRDPMEKVTIEASTTAETVERTALSEVIEVVDPETGTTRVEMRNATASVYPTAVPTQARAERESQARFRKAEAATIQLSLRVIGDPNIAAKSVVEVRGISKLLSGKYYVQMVRHVLSSSGYVCELKLTRDGVGQRSQTSVAPRRQAGPRNTAQVRAEGQLIPVERVDPETGQTHLIYRREGQALGEHDPEGSR